MCLTLTSTPIVALASSSESHWFSDQRVRRLLFPTDELPTMRTLTWSSDKCDCIMAYCELRRKGRSSLCVDIR